MMVGAKNKKKDFSLKKQKQLFQVISNLYAGVTLCKRSERCHASISHKIKKTYSKYIFGLLRIFDKKGIKLFLHQIDILSFSDFSMKLQQHQGLKLTPINFL